MATATGRTTRATMATAWLPPTSWDMGNSDMDMNPDGAGSADTVIAKMNQRLDMVSHLDADSMQGGHYGSGGDR